jgi:hypothetical protein
MFDDYTVLTTSLIISTDETIYGSKKESSKKESSSKEEGCKEEEIIFFPISFF